MSVLLGLTAAGAALVACALEDSLDVVESDDVVSEEVVAAQAATSRANVAPNAAQRRRLPMTTF